MSEPIETLITVDVTHEEELGADGFDLFVTVRGSSLFTGSSAFDKAAEVKSIVASAIAAGTVRAGSTNVRICCPDDGCSRKRVAPRRTTMLRGRSSRA